MWAKLIETIPEVYEMSKDKIYKVEFKDNTNFMDFYEIINDIGELDFWSTTRFSEPIYSRLEKL